MPLGFHDNNLTKKLSTPLSPLLKTTKEKNDVISNTVTYLSGLVITMVCIGTLWGWTITLLIMGLFLMASSRHNMKKIKSDS